MTKQKIPNIRFKNYTDAWEQRKLGEVVNRFDNQRVPITANDRVSGTTPYYGANGIQDYVEGFTHDGEFILVAEDGASDLKNYPVQYVSGKVWVNNHAHVIQGKANIANNRFLQSAIKTINIEPFLVGGSRAKLNADVMMKLPTKLPKIDEQAKIGSFFQSFENLIALHQRKLNELKSFKSTMLSKMFPKHGQTVPEIRLAGFDGEWEEMMLGEHSRIIAGGTPKTKIKDYWNPKEIPWMSSGEINNKFLNFTYDLISKKGLANSSAKWVRKHSVLIALAGQGKTRGTVAVNNIDLTTNQSIAAIEPDASVNYLFLFYELEKRYDELRQISSGDGTRGGLNKKIISEIRVKLPLIEEQQAIGKFFANLDDMILATQSKVDKLEILKKKLLQEMFV